MTVSRRDQRDHDGAAEEFVRAVAGDAASFAAFLARFEGRIARTVRALVPAADAEDVFQEVCLRLVAKGHLYDPVRPLVPWLDAVTRQVCLSALRRRKREGRTAIDLHSVARAESPPAPDADPWVRDVLADYLRSLPAAEREVLRLVFAHGLTQREAAKRAGVPPGTVATWIARAVRTLRSRFGDECP